MPRPQDLDNRTERQQQILQAAQTVIAERGLADARMDDIAHHSGLSKGTLYLYYKNKDDLVAGLLQMMLDSLLTQLRILNNLTEDSVEDRLKNYVASLLYYMDADASVLNIAYEFYAVAARRPAIRQMLQQYFAEYREVLKTLFLQGIEDGTYPQFDASQAAITLIALLEGLTLLWFTDPEAIHLDPVLPRVVHNFLEDLKHKEHGHEQD